MGRNSRSKIEKRELQRKRRNSEAWGNPSGDPVVAPSDIRSRSFAVSRTVSAHRSEGHRVSRDPRLTTNDRRWDK